MEREADEAQAVRAQERAADHSRAAAAEQAALALEERGPCVLCLQSEGLCMLSVKGGAHVLGM